MFYFGMIQNGPRGIHPTDDEDIDNVYFYGIDWEDYDNDQILKHHCQSNLEDYPNENPS